MKKTRKIVALIIVIAIVAVTFSSTPDVYSASTPGVVLDKTEMSSLKRNSYKETEGGEKEAFMESLLELFGVDSAFAEKVNDYYKDRFFYADEIGGIYKGDNAETNTAMASRSSGSNENHYDKMDLAVMYAKNGNTITMLGFYTWKEMPWLKSDDIIGIGTEGGSINQEEAFLYVQYTNRAGQELDATFYEGYNTDECTYIGKCATAAFEYNLPDDITAMSAMIGSEVDYSMETTITAQYFHKKFLVNLSPSISYVAGISVSPVSFVDEYYVQCGVS